LALVVSAASGSKTSTYAIPGDAVFPEGIGYEGGRSFYVSSTGDGSIFKGTIGKRTLKPYLPAGEDGRTTAVGVEAALGRLYVAGGATGQIWIYESTGSLGRRYETGTGGFLNDVAVTRDGDVYVTDSLRPYLYLIGGPNVDVGGGFSAPLEPFLTLDEKAGYDGSPGFKWNGIVATPNGKILITVHSSRGELYRVNTVRDRVTKIDTGGADLTNGDGLVLNGSTLYVVQNQQGRIVELKLNRSFTRARQKRTFTDRTFEYPTSAALAKGRLLVVNSQFDRRNAGAPPDLPFTVSSVKRP
jgi:sugar lactone lactonase YvrE